MMDSNREEVETRISDMVRHAGIAVNAWDGRPVEVFCDWLDDESLVINCKCISSGWGGIDSFAEYARVLVCELGGVAQKMLADSGVRGIGEGEWVAYSEPNYFDKDGDEVDEDGDYVTVQCCVYWTV